MECEEIIFPLTLLDIAADKAAYARWLDEVDQVQRAWNQRRRERYRANLSRQMRRPLPMPKEWADDQRERCVIVWEPRRDADDTRPTLREAIGQKHWTLQRYTEQTRFDPAWVIAVLEAEAVPNLIEKRGLSRALGMRVEDLRWPYRQKS